MGHRVKFPDKDKLYQADKDLSPTLIANRSENTFFFLKNEIEKATARKRNSFFFWLIRSNGNDINIQEQYSSSVKLTKDIFSSILTSFRFLTIPNG